MLKMNRKSKGLLKFVTLLGIGIGLMGAGGITANASSASDVAKGSWAYYKSKTIPYKINSSSTHYRNIWKKAIKNWNSKHVVKLKSVKTNKKAVIHMTSLAKFSDDYNKDVLMDNNLTGVTVADSYTVIATHPYSYGELISKTNIYLNREKLNNANYTDNQKVNVATRELGYSMGLKYNNRKGSVMSRTNRTNKISKYDLNNLKRNYKGMSYLSGPIEPK